MATQMDPITVTYPGLLKVKFLKEREKVHITGIF